MFSVLAMPYHLPDSLPSKTAIGNFDRIDHIQ